MSTPNKLLQSAVAAILALSSVQVSAQDKKQATEKCYGIAKAGQNDCGNRAPLVRRQGDPGQHARRVEVRPQGTCEKLGGKTSGGGADPGKAPKSRAN